jgi:hypothetical protein
VNLGNIAIGNLHQFLPVIVKIVESDPKRRLLSLHALKEVIISVPLNYDPCCLTAVCRSLLTVPMANWKGLQICFGFPCLRIQRIRKRRHAMSLRHVLGSWQLLIPQDICHSYTWACLLRSCFVSTHPSCFAGPNPGSERAD